MNSEEPNDSPESAMRRFFLSPDLLRCLGEQVQSKSTLSALCLTNSLFNAEFSYFLYQDIHIAGDWTDKSLHASGGWTRRNTNRQYLHHVRKATIQIKGYTANPALFNLHLQRIFPNLPNLKILDWQTIPITLQTLRVIKEHCQKLEALSVCDLPTWGRQADDDTTFSWAESMTGNLSGMQAPGELFPSNLRCFNLHNMHGNLAAHRNIIVTVLKQCLRLEHLGLSLYRDYPLFGRQGEWWLFFDKLCDEYEENGGAPLKLKSLDLGSLVFPTREESLAKLTDLAHLTSLRVDNSDHTMLTNFPPAKFEAINAVNCPQLVHLALAKDSPDGADIVRRLLHAVDERLIQPPFPKLMDLLTSSHVVSYADLYSVWIMNSDDAPTQDVKPSLPFRMLSASLAVERDYDEDTGPEWDIHTAVESFHLLVQTTKDTLEGLAIELPCYIASPFKENDEESWGQPIPGDISMEVNLHISRLSHLTQLAVVVVGHEWGEVWNGLNDQQSLVLAEEYARLLPRLRYIRVDCWYWKVSRHWEDLGFTLQETERYEAGRVELFYRYFPTSTRGNNRAQVDRRDLPYLTVP